MCSSSSYGVALTDVAIRRSKSSVTVPAPPPSLPPSPSPSWWWWWAADGGQQVHRRWPHQIVSFIQHRHRKSPLFQYLHVGRGHLAAVWLVTWPSRHVTLTTASVYSSEALNQHFKANDLSSGRNFNEIQFVNCAERWPPGGGKEATCWWNLWGNAANRYDPVHDRHHPH